MTTARRGPPHDPHELIAQVLAMGPEFAGPAEDILLSWVLSLEIDPATAAATLLDAYGQSSGALPPGATGRLWQLLRETAAPHPNPPPLRGRGRRKQLGKQQ